MSLPSPDFHLSGTGREALSEHAGRFGRPAAYLIRAPGRVNLIGEHVDYHDGVVLPFAIGPSASVAVALGEPGLIEAYSHAGSETIRISIDEAAKGSHATHEKSSHWSYYVRGMLRLLSREGFQPRGSTLWIGGDLPLGAGLSSSAALSVGVGLALLAVSQTRLDRLKLAEMARRVEHEFVGTPCGLMDPYAVCFAQADHVLRLDCRAGAHEQVPLDLGAARLVLIHSGVRHALADGAYENRVSAGMRALQAIRSRHPHVTSLRDATPEILEAGRASMNDEDYRRARHVVSELRRVELAARALRLGDYPALGRLLSESHASLRDDYETSCPDVEELRDLLLACPGVYGARMIGGGFGGMLLALVHPDEIEALHDRVQRRFLVPREIPNASDYPLIVHPADGASVIPTGF